MAKMSLDEITQQENCNFCKESRLKIGEKSDYGAVTVLKTGNSEGDWYATLQPKTPSNPEAGMNLLLMPVYHLEAFSQIFPKFISQKTSNENFGYSFALLSYAMQEVLSKEWNEENGIFVPSQVVYGKCLTPENTKPHLHLRLCDFSGDIAQSNLSDTSWEKKEVFAEGDREYVKASPVKKRKIASERFDRIASRLIEICNNPYKF